MIQAREMPLSPATRKAVQSEAVTALRRQVDAELARLDRIQQPANAWLATETNESQRRLAMGSERLHPMVGADMGVSTLDNE